MNNSSIFDHADLDLVQTNPDCIFSFDDVFSEEDMERIRQHNWRARAWENGWNYHGILNFGDKTLPELVPRLKNYHSNEIPFSGLGVLTAARLLEKIDNGFSIRQHIGSYWTIQDESMNNPDQVHRDYFEFEPAWSILFHLIGDSGPTEFYHTFQDKIPFRQIDFKPGRAIIFPCLYPHRAGQPNSSLRVCHSVRLILNFKPNNNILDLNKDLANKYPQTIACRDLS